MHYGGPLLLDGVSVDVEKGDRIGVIGRNGTGKTTLLRLLGGRLEPTAGHVASQRGLKVAYQAQELEYTPGATVFEEMRSVFADQTRREERLRELEERIAAGEQGLLNEYESLQQQQTWDADRRIETMLSSLGLGEETWQRPVADFSGGERNVIGLARVLLSDPDVMLLDEPSNHLDMDGVEWFIGFLRRSSAAVIMVSHNRHLLDATTKTTWELRSRNVTSWTGNYTEFCRQKEEAEALQARQFKVQQRLVRRIEFQARRLMDMANAYDDPSQARRAKSMLKRLDRMDRVEAPDKSNPMFRASLGGGARHGRIALQVNDFSFGYDDRAIFEGASLEIEYGDRVCLVGPNGSGKTTLFRHILDQGSWENPTLRLGKTVSVGEYNQLHDVLDADATLQAWVSRETGLSYSPAADLLHRFLFTRDDLERRIGTLSGGEKSRLQLARLVHAKVNFLLLDEPTNHLDITACEQLEEMLQEFDGTLFVISHDRYFLDKLVDHVVEIEDRQLVTYTGSFAAWWQRRAERRRKGALEDRSEPKDKSDARERFEQRKAKRREADRIRRRVQEVEARISELERKQVELEARLEQAYSTGDAAESVSREFAAVRGELSELYAEWEQIAAALDD